MPNYKLALEIDKKNYKIIEWNKIIGIDTKKSNQLEILDTFTSQYKNEHELKTLLLKSNLITNDDLNKNLCIIYKYNGEIKKLIYGLSYSESKQYFSEYKLTQMIINLSSDIEFLKKLYKYCTFRHQTNNAYDIGRYIGDVYSNGGKTFYSNYLNYTLDNFLKKELYNNANSKINYSRLRALAMFIYNYILTKNPTKEISTQSNFTGKKSEPYTQITIFQCNEKNSNNKININNDKEEFIDEELRYNKDDDKEPLFIPNSEEERRYIEYMEDLPDEEIDNDYEDCIEENSNYETFTQITISNLEFDDYNNQIKIKK